MVDRKQAGPLKGSASKRYAEVFDFGAAFFYTVDQRDAIEPVEVRAMR
jgi:hypothetical protein